MVLLLLNAIVMGSSFCRQAVFAKGAWNVNVRSIHQYTRVNF